MKASVGSSGDHGVELRYHPMSRGPRTLGEAGITLIVGGKAVLRDAMDLPGSILSELNSYSQ